MAKKLEKRPPGLPAIIFADAHPKLAKEWHPSKNGKLKPTAVPRDALEPAWWQCSKNKKHVWQASVMNRVYRNDGCRLCNGEHLDESHPEIAKEWHSTLNGELTPSDVRKSDKRPVYWQCRKNKEHVWKTSVSKRTYGKSKCPKCTRSKFVLGSLAEMAPEKAKLWHKKKNGELTPADVGFKSQKIVWWQCDKAKSHVFESRIHTVVTSTQNGCSFCSGVRVSSTNSLAARFPKIASEWHPSKNKGLSPHDLVYGSNQYVWWQCKKRKHEWVATVNSRTANGRNCPACSGHALSDDNRLSMVHPELVKQWHPTKNGKLTPDDVSFGAQTKVWWQCEVHESHVWDAAPYARSRGIGCPCCSGFKVCQENCLATRYPLVAQQWHPTKNGKLSPRDVTSRTHREVWWKCISGHVWKAQVSSVVDARVERLTNGCMKCYLLEVRGEKFLHTQELEDQKIEQRKKKFGYI